MRDFSNSTKNQTRFSYSLSVSLPLPFSEPPALHQRLLGRDRCVYGSTEIYDYVFHELQVFRLKQKLKKKTDGIERIGILLAIDVDNLYGIMHFAQMTLSPLNSPLRPRYHEEKSLCHQKCVVAYLTPQLFLADLPRGTMSLCPDAPQNS